MSEQVPAGVRIRFDSPNHVAGLSWIRTGQDAIDQATVDLRRKGIDVSVEQIHTPAEAGAKGALIDDLLIGIAASLIANGIASLLSLTVRALFARPRRPDAIALMSGGSTLRIDSTESEASADVRVHQWVQTHVATGSNIVIAPAE